jgi:hypothetical protein
VRRVALAPARRYLVRAPVRAAVLRVAALSGKRSGSSIPERRASPSLDGFLADQGGSGALLGFAVVHAESGTRLGTVREVLTVAGGEVVFKASGDGAAATDEEGLLNALAGFGDWDTPTESSSAESTLLRVEGAGCVRGSTMTHAPCD